jgi:hypothetical protein
MRMDLKVQLNEAMKQAMRARDEVRLRTVRMALANIQQTEVDEQTTLDNEAVKALLQKEMKNRREAVTEAKRANRSDLVDANEAEMKVLEEFLPKAMDSAQLRGLAQAAIAEVGATGPSDMGKVMKVLLPRVAGQAAGDQVSAAVRELLTSK